MARFTKAEREVLMTQVVNMRRAGMSFQHIADNLCLGRRQTARLLWIAGEQARIDQECRQACVNQSMISIYFPPSPAMEIRLRREFGDEPFTAIDEHRMMLRSAGDGSEQEPF